MITFFNINNGKCPLCLADAKVKEDFTNCGACGTVFTKFSIIFPAEMEIVEEAELADQEMT